MTDNEYLVMVKLTQPLARLAKNTLL